MADAHEIHLLSHGKTLIQRQRGWEDNALLSEAQAQELGTAMTDKLGIPVNVGELRSFWNQPTEIAIKNGAMLEMLAKFQDYSGWKEFQDMHQLPLLTSKAPLGGSDLGTDESLAREALLAANQKNRQLKAIAWILGVVNVLLLGFLLYRILT